MRPDRSEIAAAGSPPMRSPSASAELRALVRLAAPLSLVHFGQVLLGAVDTAVVGRLGEAELGATGLGNAIYFTILVAGIGVMLGLDPLISQAVGAGEVRRARKLLWQGAYVALIVGTPLMLAVGIAMSVLPALGIEPATAGLTVDYLLPRLPVYLPHMIFVGTRSYLQSHGRTRPLVAGVVTANVVNLPLSWLLVFGDSGLVRFGLPAVGVPAFGVAGAGWTSTVCTLIQLAFALVALRDRDVPAERGVWRLDPRLVRRTLGLGLPIGLTLLGEVGVFAIVNVAMGNLSSAALAGHQVAITLAALTYMIPVGIGAAASVRVGQAVGRRDVVGTRRAGIVGLGVGLAFMSIAAFAFYLFPEALARVITDKPGAIRAAVPLVLVAAVFQLSDGAQAVAAGALRGAGDTRTTLYANLGGHYLIGLPISLLLGFRLSLGAVGLWWGLCAGLTAVALTLAVRFATITRRPIERS